MRVRRSMSGVSTISVANFWTAASSSFCDRLFATAFGAGWVSMLAIGIATERSATTRLGDSLSLSRVDQPGAIGMANEHTATTRPKGLTARPPWQRISFSAARLFDCGGPCNRGGQGHYVGG